MMINSLVTILAQAEPAAQRQAGIMDMLIPMGLLFAMMYFLMIRPQQKKMKEHQKLVDSLKVGDKVVAAGGIHGVITSLKDKSVGLKIADQVKIEIERASITVVDHGKDEKEEKEAK
ncbi:MAG: preprotein translocase subunit YajC [Verrucomicrobiota bacterium]